MSSINKVILVGRLGVDPELRYTPSGKAYCRFRIATSRQWRNKEGESQEEVCWHRIVCWGKQAEICNQYLAKGRQVYIEGRIRQFDYQDNEGQNRRLTEVVSSSVVFLGGKHASAPASPSLPSPSPSPSSELAEEELPF